MAYQRPTADGHFYVLCTTEMCLEIIVPNSHHSVTDGNTRTLVLRNGDPIDLDNARAMKSALEDYIARNS